MQTVELATRAAIRAGSGALISAGANFGSRVYWGLAEEGTAYPYVVYDVVSGADPLDLRNKRRAEIVLQFVCVSAERGGVDAFVESMAGAASIRETLDYAGTQDNKAGVSALDGGNDWVITSMTVEGLITIIEHWEATVRIYRAGYQVRLIMEQK